MTDDRALQLRLTGFRKAEASLRLEGMDPSGTPLYESVKTRILSGDITFDEGRTEIRAHYQKRANSN
ncbi:antitoxin VbhA family protein [Escherichia coli]|nr:antitoxin VbhA family protein [Escherichia coli]EFT4610584.1 antitoxin VbhA family protein [Escherichia coli]EHW5598620.1 antitoxin VbhA family protein [Escherichia coli]EIY5954256.1 antitoxin VbhA family protein [Escherichia coli]